MKYTSYKLNAIILTNRIFFKGTKQSIFILKVIPDEQFYKKRKSVTIIKLKRKHINTLNWLDTKDHWSVLIKIHSLHCCLVHRFSTIDKFCAHLIPSLLQKC